MLKNSICAAFVLLCALPALGQDIDPRSAAMGGTGVASSSYLSAGFLNPALLTNYSEEAGDDWGIMLPAVSVLLADPNELLDDIENFDSAFTEFENALNSNTATPAQAQALVDLLNRLDGKQGYVRAGAGLVVALPSRDFATALVISRRLDANILTNLDANDIGLIIASIGGPTPTLGSEAIVVAAEIQNIGLAMAREFSLGGRPVSFGITPKIQTVNVFNYSIAANNAEANIQDEFDNEIYRNNDSWFNVDLGATMQFSDQWRFGMNLRNALEQDINTTTRFGRSYSYTLSPVLTAGAAYQWSFLTLAADLDLTAQEGFAQRTGPVGIRSSTQFLRLGVEAATKWAQVRVGYRTDMEDTLGDMFTAGIGLSPWGVFHIDLAGGLGDNSYSAGIALSVTL